MAVTFKFAFFWYRLISYQTEALKALQEEVKAIEPFIAITLNWTIPLGSCMSSRGGKSRVYYVGNYVLLEITHKASYFW